MSEASGHESPTLMESGPDLDNYVQALTTRHGQVTSDRHVSLQG